MIDANELRDALHREVTSWVEADSCAGPGGTEHTIALGTNWPSGGFVDVSLHDHAAAKQCLALTQHGMREGIDRVVERLFPREARRPRRSDGTAPMDDAELSRYRSLRFSDGGMSKRLLARLDAAERALASKDVEIARMRLALEGAHRPEAELSEQVATLRLELAERAARLASREEVIELLTTLHRAADESVQRIVSFVATEIPVKEQEGPDALTTIICWVRAELAARKLREQARGEEGEESRLRVLELRLERELERGRELRKRLRSWAYLFTGQVQEEIDRVIEEATHNG